MTSRWRKTRGAAENPSVLGDDPLAALCAVVPLVPIPSARPAYERFDEAAGLTLLELSLRMDHVHRVTEELTFVDSTHMRRSVSVDVDLRRLSARQRNALRARPVGPLPDTGPDGPVKIWVPIARQSRGDLASVEIKDQTGDLTPRLTSDATRWALVAGLASFVKTQIIASGELRGDQFLQARWLIEQAVAHYVERGSPQLWERLRSYAGAPDAGVHQGRQTATVGSDDPIEGPAGVLTSAQIRQRALEWLRGEGPAGGAPIEVRRQFAQLLEIGAEQQLLIVLLDARPGEDHVHLHFEAPPVPVRPGPDGVARSLGDLVRFGREYRVEYETQVPRHASSYHVAVEVPEEMKVRRFLLSSDANEDAVRRLAEDIEQLARNAASLRAVGSAAAVAQVRRAELVDVLARVASLSRLRNADLTGYRGYMVKTFAALGGRFPDRALRRWKHELRRTDRAIRRAGVGDVDQARCRAVVDEVRSGRVNLAVLGALAVHHERGALAGALVALDDEALATTLHHLADYLRSSEIGRDVVVDNDPRENGAHAHWSRPELRFGPSVNEPVHVRFTLALADEPPALAETVSWMVLFLLVVVVVLATSLEPTKDGLSQADAIVAVLLLVPSILLSRLEVASKRTVLGELRQLPRNIAYLSVIVTAALALVVAGDPADFPAAAWSVAGALGVLLAGAWFEIAVRTFRRRRLVPRSVVTPLWLVEAMTGRRPGGDRDGADARFDAIGPAAGAETAGLARSWIIVNATILVLKELGRPFLGAWRKGWSVVFRRRHPVPSSRHVPGLGSVEAVSRAARVAAERRTAIEFTVAHLRGVTSGHSEQGGHRPDDDCRGMAEVFAMTTLGSTVEIRTRSVSDPAFVRHRAKPGQSRLVDLKTESRHDPALNLVKGHLRTGPSAVVVGDEYNEILLQVGPQDDLSPRQARSVVHVVHELSWRMTSCGALPVHITFPAAEPSTGSSAAENPRGASAPYMRLAVSNAGDHAAGRTRFEEELITFAQDTGLGLWLSQGRASSDVAQWRQVVPFVKAKFLDKRETLFEDAADDPAVGDGDSLDLVTFLLPTSADVPRSLAELACRVYRDGLGVHALTSWSMQQAVFVTAAFRRIARPSVDHHSPEILGRPDQGPWFGRRRPRAPLDVDRREDTYRRLSSRAALDPGGPCGCERPDSIARQVGDRERRVGRAYEPAPPDLVSVTQVPLRPRARRPDIRVVPFWVGWRIPERMDVDVVATSLVAAFTRHNANEHAWVTFLRARHDDRDHSKGRAKVAVPVPSDWTPADLGILAQMVQEDVRAELAKEVPGRGDVMSFQVAWGERWLDGSR